MKILKYILIALIVIAVAFFIFKGFKSEVPVAPVNETVSNSISLAVGVPHTIQWNPYDIVSDTVNLNLIRKHTNGAVTYEFVKVLSEDTLNDGLESWSPLSSDVGKDLYIQVSCNTSKEACESVTVKAPITVVNGNSSNTAVILEAVK